MKQATSQVLADLLASLSDPTRLRLVRLLEAEELAVGEISRVVQLPQSTVSRHLKVLGDAGWLQRRSEGTAGLYRVLCDDLGEQARGVWHAVRAHAHELPEAREDDRRLRAVLAERRIDSASFFGRVRGEWDQVRSELFGTRSTTLALLGLLPREWTIADFGCGTGATTLGLACFARRVVGVEQSPEMLAAARERTAGISNVELVQAPVEHTGLASASVDAAVCALVLHHVDEPSLALREMRRVLRAGRGGGRVLIVDMVEHGREEYRRTMGHKHLGFSQGRVEELLREAGFTDRWWCALPPEGDARGPGLFVATGRVPTGEGQAGRGQAYA